jgi:CDP-diacylglycerol--serine O-phosphatidyltransferase
MHILPQPPPEDDRGPLVPMPPPKYKNAQEAARIYFLPNLFTAGNLFFGFIAIIRCIQARYVAISDSESNDLYTQAVWCILLAAFCDALDGRLARLGGRESLFGKEFDSIADTVSFGVAPALMVFFLILGPGLGRYSALFQQIGWLVGFIYLLCVSVRLARFNVITNPLLPGVSETASTKDFMGLPSPAAAGFVASLVFAMLHMDFEKDTLQQFAILLLPLLLLVALLMVSNIPYPSFKHIDWQTQTKSRPFIFFIFTIAILAISLSGSLPGSLPDAYRLRFVSPAIFFLCYIFYGLFRYWRRTVRRKQLPPPPPDPDDPEPDEAF